jgi:hypothetical protein
MWMFSKVSGTNSIQNSSGYFVGLVAPNLMMRWTPSHQFWRYQTTACPEDGDGVISQNVRKPLHTDAAVCLRKFHWFVEADENKHSSTTHYRLNF